MASTLDGRVSLVTGGSSGIGRATALAFAREGAKVVVADLDPYRGEETVSRIDDAAGQSIFVRADVSQSTEVAALIGSAVEH